MIESYFFIPANHPKLQEKQASIEADHIIIDLEDAVSKVEFKESLDTVLQLESVNHLWVRPVVFQENLLETKVFTQLNEKGFKNFVIPKTRNLSQIIQLEKSLPDEDLSSINIILLIENPECLLNLNLILQNTRFNIIGVGFGSQDFCTDTGMQHTHDLLRLPRFIIFCAAKAHKIKSIDIASMDIIGNESFKTDLRETIEMGYDGKFVIHPKQLKIIKDYEYFTSEEIDEAHLVMNEYERLNKPAVFIYNNQAIEPPHIKRYEKIIKWTKKNERK